VTNYARWRRLLESVRSQMSTIPDVVGVGLGPSTTGRLAWRVYVDTDGHVVVPPTVMGLPTTVIVRSPTARTNGPPPFVLTAGIPIETNHKADQGTLGGFAQDKNGFTVLVTCSHVLFPHFEVIPELRVATPRDPSWLRTGYYIGRPRYDETKPAQQGHDGDWWEGYHEGTWTGGFELNSAPSERVNAFYDASRFDCAVAALDPGIQFLNAWNITDGGTTTTIPIKGAFKGIPDDQSGDSREHLGVVKGPDAGKGLLPSADQYVRVYSAVTGKLRYGTLISTPKQPGGLSLEFDPDCLIYRYTIEDSSDNRMGIKRNFQQFLIVPRPAPVPGKSLQELYAGADSDALTFSSGDSGSWVINSDNLVIGMIIRSYPVDKLTQVHSSDLEFRRVGRIGVATPIARVLEQLSISIPASETGWSGTLPSKGPAISAPIVIRGPRSGEWIVRELTRSLRGRLLLGKLARGRHEVGRILLTRRSVAAAWRELNGPAFYRHCVRGVETPTYRIPMSINGVSRAQLVNDMLPLLHMHGSARLRKDIDRYGNFLAAFVAQPATMQDVPLALSNTRLSP